MFSATVAKEGNTNIVYVRGRLNAATADEFSKVLQSLVSTESNEVILEMSELSYITSDGLKPLLVWLKATQTIPGKRSLAVCNLQEFVATIFQHAGFDKKFPIYNSISAAMRG